MNYQAEECFLRTAVVVKLRVEDPAWRFFWRSSSVEDGAWRLEVEVSSPFGGCELGGGSTRWTNHDTSSLTSFNKGIFFKTSRRSNI